MSEWFYALGGEKLGPVSESELVGKIRRREIGTATLVWSESLTEWARVAMVFPEVVQSLPRTAICAVTGERRLVDDMLQYGNQFVSVEHKAEFVQALQSGDPLRPKLQASRFGYVYRNPQASATASNVLIIIGVVLAVFEVILLSFHQPWKSEAANDPAESSLFLAIVMLWIFRVLLFLLTVLIYCLWKYGVSRNANAFTNAAMKFSPGWAVGYYFVPILLFWRPFFAMKEIFIVSCENQRREFLLIWWILLLITVFGQYLAIISAGVPEVSFAFKVAGTLSSIPLMILSWRLIRSITSAQVIRGEKSPG